MGIQALMDQMSQFFASGGQSSGVSASASVLPMNIQDCIFFRIDWLDILAVQGTLKSFLQHYSSKPLILWGSALIPVMLAQTLDIISYSLEPQLLIYDSWTSCIRTPLLNENIWKQSRNPHSNRLSGEVLCMRN